LSAVSLSEQLAPRDRPGRRNTAHLKLVPPSRALRDQLRQAAEQAADRLDKRVPMTKDQLEQVARTVLAEHGQPEGYTGWMMVLVSSAFWREAVAAVPPSRRLFLLPHCLKHAEGCPAEYNEFGMECRKCGACSIADFRTQAEDMGYRVLVAEGSPVVMKIIVSGYIDAIVGVACLNVLEKAIDKILLAGIPCMAVPLLSSDCRNTSVDEQWVSEMVLTEHRAAAPVTRSYVHLMRTAAEMFSPRGLQTLVPLARSAEPVDDLQVADLDAIDPIAATERIGYDFLARGGKYARPFITLAAYDAMRRGDCTRADGAEHAAQIPPAVKRAAMSIEAFHKASLVHDDIEDDDGFRYGQLSIHRRFGTATAINVGDYLIGLGYRLVARESGSLGSDTVADLLDCLAQAHTRLAEGQGAELLWRDNPGREITPLDALKIYALKTAPAFEAALFSGVRLAGPADDLREPIKQFARNLGVAFQILNDLHDWQTDSHNKLTSGGDVLGGRPTVLYALALQQLGPAEREQLRSLVRPPSFSDDVTHSPRSIAERLAAVKRLYESCGIFDQAHRLVDKHQERAEQIAQQVASDDLRRLLIYLIDTVLDRPAAEPAPTVVNLHAVAPLPITSPAP